MQVQCFAPISIEHCISIGFREYELVRIDEKELLYTMKFRNVSEKNLKNRTFL